MKNGVEMCVVMFTLLRARELVGFGVCTTSFTFLYLCLHAYYVTKNLIKSCGEKADG